MLGSVHGSVHGSVLIYGSVRWFGAWFGGGSVAVRCLFGAKKKYSHYAIFVLFSKILQGSPLLQLSLLQIFLNHGQSGLSHFRIFPKVRMYVASYDPKILRRL